MTSAFHVTSHNCFGMHTCIVWVYIHVWGCTAQLLLTYNCTQNVRCILLLVCPSTISSPFNSLCRSKSVQCLSDSQRLVLASGEAFLCGDASRFPPDCLAFKAVPLIRCMITVESFSSDKIITTTNDSSSPENS